MLLEVPGARVTEIGYLTSQHRRAICKMKMRPLRSGAAADSERGPLILDNKEQKPDTQNNFGAASAKCAAANAVSTATRYDEFRCHAWPSLD